MIGKVPTIDAVMSGDFATLMELRRQVRTLKVRTNADTPKDAAKARDSAPRGSASAGPSTCSSRASGSSTCAR